MLPIDTARAAAHDLLGSTAHEPISRARRISAIYACCYLEDPFVGAWVGLASYVGRRVHHALEGPASVWRDLMGDGNQSIYMALVPAWLLFRAGAPIPGPLSPGFNQVRLADLALRHRPVDPGAFTLAERGLAEICEAEQREILQPAYDALDPAFREPLRALFSFRLGLAPIAPVLSWDDAFGAPWIATDRCRWMNARVLPAWARARALDESLVRAEVDRTRRWGGMRCEELRAAVAGLSPAAASSS